MTLSALAHHLLLVLSLAALGAAALRLAALVADRTAERTIAAAVFGAAAAGIQALALGLAGIGTEPLALAAAAAATWVLARVLVPRPQRPLQRELWTAWRGAPLIARLGLGAALGAWLAWAVWLVRYPGLGIDSVGYHLPEVVGWVHNGSPGSILPIFPGLPVGNYPLTNEVLLAWGSGVGRSFAFVVVWCPLMLGLLGLATWSGLRSLLVGALPAALAVLALCLTPVLTHYQMNGANTDLPALTWLACCCCLALGSLRHRPLLVPAIVAAGLAIGTKTTAAPLALGVLAAAALAGRRELRSLLAPLALGAVAAAMVGGAWYLRNLVDHGSPLWPFVAAPWGDPLPAEIGPARGVNSSFLDRPGFTLERVGDGWLELFGSGFLLMAGALVAGVVARSRAVAAAAAVTAAALLLWVNAPFTGASVREFEVATISTVRYLLPALAAALVALALSSGSPRRPVRIGTVALLAVAVVVGAVQTADLGFPAVPRPWTVLAGAALGMGMAFALSRLRLPAVGRSVGVAALPAGAILAALALSAAGHGFVERHAAAAGLFGTDTVRWFTGQADFRGPGRTVAGAPVVLGPLAGDALQHRFEWVPAGEPCRAVLARRREGWVLALVLPDTATRPARSGRCLAGERPSFEGLGFSVYSAARARAEP